MAAKSVLTFLRAVQRAGGGIHRSGNGYRTPCRAHGGEGDNLAVSSGENGRLLLKCHSHDCSYEDILAAYELTPKDVSVGSSAARDLWMPCQSKRERRPCRGHKAAEYEYRDEKGRLLFATCRCSLKGEGCHSPFAQWRPDGDRTSGKSWSLKGVRRVIYRLPQVLKAVEEGRTIWITEGEKDAERAVKEGLEGTSPPMGAGNWEKSFARWLKGASVVIVADRDEKGIAHAFDIADSLEGIAVEVEVKQAAINRKGADLTDHLDSGFTLEELQECPRPEPEENELDEEDQFDLLADQMIFGAMEEAAQEGGTPPDNSDPEESPSEQDVNLTEGLGADTSGRLPEAFWNSSVRLSHIRQAAEADLVCPDAALHAVLTRLSAYLSPSVTVSSRVRKPVSLSFYTALCGASGTGKSAAVGLAEMLLPQPEGLEEDLAHIGLSTGQGVVAAFCGPSPGEEGGYDQVRSRGLALMPEGGIVTTLGRNDGSILDRVLCSAWVAETTSQSNATTELRRGLKDGQYRLAMLLGLQTGAAEALLDMADVGLPQRLLWAPAAIPSQWLQDTPETVYPGDLRATAEFASGLTGISLKIPQEASQEIRKIILELAAGRGEDSPLDTHEPIARLKLAGLLAILHHRTTITEEDWELARTMWKTSCAWRETIVQAVEKTRRDREASRRRAVVATAVASERAVSTERKVRKQGSESDTKQDLVHRVAWMLTGKVQRADGPVSRRDLHKAIGSKHRARARILGLEDLAVKALERAQEENWITSHDGGKTWTV